VPHQDVLPLKESPLNMVAEMVENGRIPSTLAKVYIFEEIQEAHSLLDSGQAGGKIVMRI